MKLRKWLVAAAIVLAPMCTMAAGVPQLINYQGRLMDDAGVPVTGNVEMHFKLFDSEIDGTPLLTILQTNVQVTNGLYNVLLGSGTVLPGVEPDLKSVFEKHPQVYLAVSVDNGDDLSPRQLITSVPYALSVDFSAIDRYLNNEDYDGDGHDKMLAGGMDCDDNNAGIHPGSTEVPCDGIDQDCDGADYCFVMAVSTDYVGNNVLYHGLLTTAGLDSAGLSSTNLGTDPSLDPMLTSRDNSADGEPPVIFREAWSAVGLGSVAMLDSLSGFTIDHVFAVNNTVNPSNPQDIVRLGTNKAYVTRFEPPYNDISIVDPISGNSIGRIDFTGQGTNPDGLPRLTKMIKADNKVFVLMQNFSLSFPFTYGNGRIAVIDPATDLVITTIDLSTTNPTAIDFISDQNKLIVASAGDWADTSLSGIEIVDVATLSSDTVLVRGNNAELSGFITDVVYLGIGHAYLLKSRSDYSGYDIQHLSVGTGEVSSSNFSSGYISDIAKDTFSRLLVADNAGSRVLVLDPYHLSVIDEEVLPVAPQAIINWY